jgi:hypothetical protein
VIIAPALGVEKIHLFHSVGFWVYIDSKLFSRATPRDLPTPIASALILEGVRRYIVKA